MTSSLNHLGTTQAITLNGQSDRIVRINEVSLLIGLSKQHIYRLVADAEFPKPFLIVRNGRAKGWLLSSVEGWLQSRAQGESNDEE